MLVLTAQGTACNAREVVAAAGVDGDGAVGKIGVGVLTIEEERSQRRTSPSGHQRGEWDAQGAMSGLFDGKVSTMRQVLGIE